MEKIEPSYLIPVYVKERNCGDSTLNHKKLEDITFMQFYENFFDRLNSFNSSWNWLHARCDAVHARAMSNLLGFCHEPEKIAATQEIILAMMNSHSLRQWILDQKAPYDKWADNHSGDDGIGMLQALNGMVSGLYKEFQKLSEKQKQALAPFIDYVSEIEIGQQMKDIREFIGIFEKPLELQFFIAEYDGYYGKKSFNEFTSMYYQYCNHKEGSYERTEKMRYGIDGLEMVSHFLDGEKTIAIEEYCYMQGMKKSKEPHCLIHIPKSFLVEKVFGLSYKDFLESFMPDHTQPLRMTMRIEKDQGGYSLSYTITEPSDDVVLEYVPEQKGIPATMTARPRTNKDKPKTERNAVQQSLLGVTKTVTTSMDGVYKAKVRYFNYFFSKCKEFIHDDFGYKLGELRYLAYAAEELRFMNIRSKLVFPTIIPIESNSAVIVNGVNPALLCDPENKKVTVKNTITFDSTVRVTAITGPNQNGKSRYMDMIGLFHIMFQAGWPIPADSAEISPKTDLRVHYVHSGVGITGESRFSNECLQVHNEFAQAKGKYPLFLIDEPYTGTNYGDAETLLIELLQACSEEDTTVFITTHFHGLINFIDSLPNGCNLHCVVKEDDSFTYQIQKGSSIKSNALTVAEKAKVRYGHIKSMLAGKGEEISAPVPASTPVSVSISDYGNDEDDLPF